MTDETVVVPHHPAPHTLAVEDVATGEAGDGGHRQVLLANLTDRAQHDVVTASVAAGLGLVTGEDFCFYCSWSTESQITVVGQT